MLNRKLVFCCSKCCLKYNCLTRTTKIINIVYVLTVAIFLLDGLTRFDIKSQGIKAFIYLGLLIGTPFTLVWNLLVVRKRPGRIVGAVFPIIILSSILIVGPLKILSSIGAWRTQTIMYQNRESSSMAIEYQMQDMGARGYNNRTVEVLYLTPFFTLSKEIPNDIGKRSEWIKVDKEVNELGLKFP